MKHLLYTPLLFIASLATGQYSSNRETDIFASDIQKNIFRVTLMAYDDLWPVTFSYEREIKKPFTFVLRAGPSFDFGALYSDQFSINAFASGELRYYYNLRRRIKKNKAVRNFSGIYLALEYSATSGPIALVNLDRYDAADPTTGTFTNIGYQKQFKQGYFNVFLGAKINTNDLFNEGILSADTYHIGLGIGLVLFE